ncbi:MAG TPA: ATP-binding protein, partial [Symbiobacteriaceae bacterium]|nr:ATP-binding protein [Symbiobacteriaceae bacterium]
VEREQTRRIWKAYRDVMSVATGGKLVLVDSEESSALLAEGEVRGHLELRHPEDGAVARSLVGTVLREEGFDQAEAFRLRVCVSESVTNVFKHAGKGTVTLRRTPEALRIVVADSGSGIPYDILPKAVLADGYSTQHSLGKGYSVMLRYMDRIYLGTSSQGTTVILERRAGGEPAQPENSQPGTGEGGRQVC